MDTPEEHPQTPSAPTIHTETGPGTGKTILVFALLIFFYPVGVVLMSVWMKWSLAAKIVVAIVIPFLLIFLMGILSSLLVAMIDPFEQLRKAQMTTCQSECKTNGTNACVTACLQRHKSPQQ